AGAATVTATFVLNQFTLTVAKAGNALGTVTSSPAGIDCGPTCAANFNFGAHVTLTATPTGSGTFAGWSGAGCSGADPCVVTINNAESCTDGLIPELDRGVLGGAACHDQCQTAMAAAGMPSGCWIVAPNTHCFCRSGVLNVGGMMGTQPGGSCN